MSSGSKKTTVGYWYKLLYHFGLVKGPVDAFLEMRAGDRTAWKGLLTQSGRITINKPNLWGGEKSEGGLQGEMDIIMGEPDQGPNDYLATHLGADQPTYRGKLTAVWRGGRWGAMNPYPKPAAFKLRRILKGWDGDECWYPETAVIPVGTGPRVPYDAEWKWKEEATGSTADYSASTVDDSAWAVGRGGIGGNLRDFWEGAPPSNTYVSPGAGKALWLRREIAAPTGGALRIRVVHDDGAWLWWNGAPVELESASYFESWATIPATKVNAANVIALKVMDSIPSGNPTYLYGALDLFPHDELGMNPAHILYDSLTARDMQNEPVGMINDASFRAAADKLYVEGFGLCTTYGGGPIDEFQQRICDIIGGSMTQSRVDGQYYVDLIRGDYDLESLPVIEADDIVEFSQEPSVLTEQINQIIVEWFDPQSKANRATAPLQALGAIQAAGRVNSDTRDYPELTAEFLALRVGARDLQAASTPLNRLKLTINRRRFDLRPGRQFRLQYPAEGIADMVCLLADIDYGTLTDGRMGIVAVQDVFGMPQTVYVSPEPGLAQPPDETPVASPHQLLLEAPYVELVTNLSNADLAALPGDAGALMTVATRATNGLNYSVYSAAEGEEYADNGNAEWCPSALVVEAAGYLDTEFALSGGTDLDDVEVGTWALWDSEIVRVDAIDAEAGTLTLGRGCADTVPIKHFAGARIYFCGDWAGTDDREYVDGETIRAKLLTRTSSAEQSLASAPELSVVMDQRQFRPYPPRKLRINGQAYPQEVTGSLSLDWQHSDRLMQADKLLDNEAGSVGPEAGTTYMARAYALPSDTLAAEVTGIVGLTTDITPAWTGSYRIEVLSMRDGLESLQRHTHILTYISVEAGVRVTEAGDRRVTEADNQRVTE